MIRTDYFLVIIGDLDYPSGSAPSNRIHAYSKGLIEIDRRVLAISTNPVSEGRVNKIMNYEGVDYIYPFKRFKRNNVIIRRLINLLKPFYGLKMLIKLQKASKTFSILEFSSTFYQEVFYWIFAKLARISITREANEIPYHKVNNNRLLWLKLFIYKHFRIYLYDGFIVISSLLEDYYNKHCKKKIKIIKVPILVDLTRFEIKRKPKENSPPYIAYVGSMDEKKDGVISLIKAFGLIADQAENYNLVLIGAVKKENKNRINSLIEEKQIQNKVILKGFIEKNEIPFILKNAKILALARPVSRQNCAGFPTKLGEYLATGNPVVATQLGDIGHYLTHNESILLSPPGDIKEFANNLLLLIKDNERAKTIGVNGKKVAEKSFNYKTYATSISEFFNEIQTRG